MPSFAQILKRSRLISEFSSSDSLVVDANKELLIISVFGASSNVSIYGPQDTHGSTNYKKPFQLALDAFGNTGKYGSGVGWLAEPSITQNIRNSSSPALENVGETSADNGRTSQLLKEEDPIFILDSLSSSSSSSIDGFYNEQEGILFLHLEGAYDPHVVLRACEDLKLELNDPAFIPKWCNLKSEYCQSLFLLLSLSHVMILSSSASYFDTSYIQLFRAIDAVRVAAKPYTTQLLSQLEGLPKTWVEQGRLCSPRLLFFFESESPLPPDRLENIFQSSTAEKSEKKSLEDDIYQVLRRCRVITNSNLNSLFTIQRSQEFVYMHHKSIEESSSLNNEQLYSHTIRQFCHGSNIETPTLSSGATSAFNKNVFYSQKEALDCRGTRCDFKEFVLAQIRLIRFDNGDDRRNYDHKSFVRPTWREWTEAYKKLSAFLIFGGHDEKKAVEVIGQMENYCNIDATYLEKQCQSMFTKIYGIYLKHVPEFYSKEEHTSRLQSAANAFLNISRSSGIYYWLHKLESKCESYWKNGHQQCEARSLHEHSCIKPLHRIRPKDHLEVIPYQDMDENLPEYHHNAGSRVTSYCNCGKRSFQRDEPFTIREANYDFYRRVGKDCCERLDSWEFPVFTSNLEGEHELSLQEMLDIYRSKKSIGRNANTPNGPDFEIMENENGSQAVEIELRQQHELDEDNDSLENDDNEVGSVKSNSNEAEADLTEQNCENEKDEILLPEIEAICLSSPSPLDGDLAPDSIGNVEVLSQNELPVDFTSNQTLEPEPSQYNPTTETEYEDTAAKPKLNVHRSSIAFPSSTVEYLPGMLHSQSPIGLLPVFPSWSLVCLGSSRIYSHSTGITHQPGFLAGSNFLLPWDIKVKSTEAAASAKPTPRGFRGRTNVRRTRDEFNVKVFVGLEYECKRGHRFFLEGPDKVLYHLNASEPLHKKEAGKKVATSDMPLYFKCPCSRDGRDSIAQLLRLHVVTPKAPVNVTLNPRVQPGLYPCPIFIPGSQDIKLTPSSYWILRLPYSYVGDDRVFVPPQDLASYNGRLMRGLCQVVCMSPDEVKEWRYDNVT